MIEVKRLAKPLAYRLVSLALRHSAQLAPERILDAYSQGRFPLAGRLGRINWQDPEKRAIIPIDERLHIPRNVVKFMRGSMFEVSFNRAFREVIIACATPTAKREHLWLSPELIAAYVRLHELGHAHSVEVWQDGQLVGGGYGVAIKGLFAGESMFSHVSQASKVALGHLLLHLRERGYVLQDAQVVSNLSAQFGAIEVSRAAYLRRLSHALEVEAQF